MLPNFQLRAAEDDYDRKLLSDIQTYGWHIVSVPEDANGPGFCFSVGLYYQLGHPEILVMGLPKMVGPQTINLAADYLSKGENLQSLKEKNKLFAELKCDFVPILIDHYQNYLGYANWFYHSLKKPYPAVQLVWPDKQGHLPWEDGYDNRFLNLQRLLNVV